MYEYFNKLEEFKNKDFILIPVPLHKNRMKKRKYNHMDLVCEEFSKISGFEFNPNFIARIKDTKPQYKLSRVQRLDNLSNAFELKEFLPKEKHLLLMDDICTTGATFEEIIKVLKQNGYENITCFATSTPI